MSTDHFKEVMSGSTRLLVLLFALMSLAGCAGVVHSQTPQSKWTTGFWYWHGNAAEAAPAQGTPDVLYFHAGTIWKYGGRDFAAQWSVSGELPDSLPAAHEYWLVFREEQPGVPDVSAAGVLAQRVVGLLGAARQRQLNVAGVQLDIDSPTGQLSRYANFLREVRKGVPAGFGVSITALLDWFRDGTAIGDVIKETDEFVPQFYDVAPPGSAGGWSAVAAKIDAAQWAPKFNRFGKRFRIGVSTFGRARLVPKQDPSRAGDATLGLSRLYGDLAPLDIAGNAAFNLQPSRSEANELVLDYRAVRKVRIDSSDFQPGDRIQFILSTPEAIRAAVQSAKRMGSHCAGVVFFRWPASNENLVMQPDETLRAAGLAPERQMAAGLELVNGHCAAVNCVDLYLLNTRALFSKTIRYRIRSSAELEYFLPEERVPVRMAGPAELEVTFPPYGARNRLLLGRAVTGARAEFRVEEEP